MNDRTYLFNTPLYSLLYDYPNDRFLLDLVDENLLQTQKNLRNLETINWHIKQEPVQFGHFVSWIISPTSRCDGRCNYCFADHYQLGDSPLSAKDFEKLAEQSAQAGMLRCDFSGGEPFLRLDLEDIIQAMLPYIGVVVTTSARNIHIKRLIQIANLIPFIQISLDGHTDEMNLSRHINTEKTIHTIFQAMELGLKVRILTVAHKYNQNMLREFANQLAKWGIWEWKVIRVTPAGRGANWDGLLSDWMSQKLISELSDPVIPIQLVGFERTRQRICVILEDDLHLHIDRDGNEFDLGKVDLEHPFELLKKLPEKDATNHLNYYLLVHSRGGILHRH